MDRYEEALERAKAGKPMDEVFPELKESEDEKIRKELIEQVEYILPDKEEYDDEGRVLPAYHKRIERYRAYLEKQKPAEWSEEDESYLQTVINEMEANKKEAREYEHKIYDTIILWLKSLRPQPHWKPSEEQMSMLLAIVNDPNNAGAESCHLAMQSLYNDLKKRM